MAKIYKDESERGRAARLSAERDRLLAEIAASASPGDSLEAIQGLARSQSRARASVICLADVAASRLRIASADGLPEPFKSAIDNLPIGAGNAACGTAALLRSRVITADIAADPKWTAFRQAADQHALRACWSQPIVSAAGQLLGTFALYLDRPAVPSEYEIEVLETAAELARLAIERHLEHAARHENSPPLGARFNTLRLLLVEDHVDTLETLARLLRDIGFSVQTAATVAQAEAMIDAHPFDLLISDLGLPDGTGLQIMRRAHASGIKGIALSGFGDIDDIRNSREAGFARHLTKPIRIRALEQVIVEVCGRFSKS